MLCHGALLLPLLLLLGLLLLHWVMLSLLWLGRACLPGVARPQAGPPPLVH